MSSQNEIQYGDSVELEVKVTGSSESGVLTVEREGRTEASVIEIDGIEDENLEEGKKYSLKAVTVYRPEDDPQHSYQKLRNIADEHECPSCEGELRFESKETEMSELDPDGLDEKVYYVVTSETEVYELSGSDDWIPMSQTRGRGRTSRASDVFGRIRCTECSFSVEWRRGMNIGEVEERVVEGVTGRPEENVLYSMASDDMANESVGMATGGSKDAGSFRENIREGKTPQTDALSYEGLFYDYYFDTGDEDTGEDKGLFYPTYSTAVSENPVSGETERYLSVGLNSNLTTAEFERKRLNLVVALDVSGSMSSGFREYYYDKTGTRREKDDGSDEARSKMEAATESLANLTHHLNEDDSFGVVLYNSQAHVAKPLNPVGETDMDSIRGHIRDVSAGGGTNMDDGLGKAVEMLRPETDSDPEEVENRVVFMTDAMPNTGRTGRGSLVEGIEDAAEDGIYTTFVGMGIDANEDLIESLSAVRGANHYFVHSVSEFEQRLDDEFEYMVTPLAFDLSLRVESSEYEIAEVYGSPGEDVEDGEVMNVTTLFPSPKKDGETRGGVVLLKLERTGEDGGTGEVGLEAGWVERDGTEGTELLQVSVPEGAVFDNSGIRKAVLLSRYGEEMRNWIRDVRSKNREEGKDDWKGSKERGEWEQRSVPLVVPDGYENRLKKLRDHIEGEMKSLGDDTLKQEIETVESILRRSEN